MSTLALGEAASPAPGHPVDLVGGVRYPRTQPAHGEARPHHHRQAELGDRLTHFGHGETHSAPGGFATGLGDDVLEPLPVLAALDGVEIGADEFHAVLFQHPALVQRDRGVQRGLPTQGRQQGVDLVAPLGLLGDNPLHERRGDGLYVGVVGELRVGHDGGRIRVHQADLQALGAQHPARLSPGVVELARLADDDRPGADDQHVVQIGATGH